MAEPKFDEQPLEAEFDEQPIEDAPPTIHPWEEFSGTPKTSVLDSAIAGGVQGVTLGFGDEIANLLGGDGAAFDRAAEQNPLTYGAANLVGGALPTAAAAPLTSSAKALALIGALQGAGSAKGPLGSRIKGAAIGGALGGLGGAAVPKLASKAASVAANNASTLGYAAHQGAVGLGGAAGASLGSAVGGIGGAIAGSTAGAGMARKAVIGSVLPGLDDVPQYAGGLYGAVENAARKLPETVQSWSKGAYAAGSALTRAAAAMAAHLVSQRTEKEGPVAGAAEHQQQMADSPAYRQEFRREAK